MILDAWLIVQLDSVVDDRHTQIFIPTSSTETTSTEAADVSVGKIIVIDLCENRS